MLRNGRIVKYEKIHKTEKTNVEIYEARTNIYKGGMDTTEHSVERHVVYRDRCRLNRRPHSQCGGNGRGRR